MRWPWKQRTPEIPPPPPIESHAEALERMRELAEARDRRGKRITRQTQVANAQNHFVATFKQLFPNGDSQ